MLIETPPRQARWSERAPEIVAALGSLALSAIVLARRPLPNNDGVYYLLAADAFARDGLSAASAIHSWPFHSVLIAGAAAVFGVSTELAAQGIGALLLAVASAAFVAIVRALGADRRVVWLATVVALCHPWLNRTRALIVRDGGVWAFSLLALLLLLRSDEGRRTLALVGWAVCSGLAVLFRPDATALMAGAPLAIAIAADMDRRRRFVVAFVLILPALLAAGAAAAWVAHHPSPVSPMSLDPFNHAAAALAASFPLPYGREYAPYILAWGLLAIPLVKTLIAAGPTHLVLSMVGAGRGAPSTRFQHAALLTTLAAAFGPLYLQVIRLLFVESRYTVFATLVLSVLAPFGLGWLLDPAGPRGRRATGGFFVAALALTLALSLPLQTPPKDQILAAAGWIRENAGGVRVHSNSLQIAYESGATLVDWSAVTESQVHGAANGVRLPSSAIWAVRVTPEERGLLPQLERSKVFRRVAIFGGAKGEVVMVFVCAADTCVTGQ